MHILWVHLLDKALQSSFVLISVSKFHNPFEKSVKFTKKVSNHFGQIVITALIICLAKHNFKFNRNIIICENTQFRIYLILYKQMNI